MGQIVRKLRWHGSEPLCNANTLPTALPPELLFLDFLNHRDLEMCRQLSSGMNKEILRHRLLFNARSTFQMLQIKLLVGPPLAPPSSRPAVRQQRRVPFRLKSSPSSRTAHWTDDASEDATAGWTSAGLRCAAGRSSDRWWVPHPVTLPHPLTLLPNHPIQRDTASLVGHRIFIGAPSDRVVWLEVLNIGGNDHSAARIKRDAVVLAIRNELNVTTAPAFFHFLKHLDGARFLDADVQRPQLHASARLDRALFQFTAAFSPREVELHCRPGRERLAALSNDVRLDLSAILRLVVNPLAQDQDVEDEDDA
jgi:hypothetical protein